MILFVIAVGCGLVASIGVSQYMETGTGAAVPTDKIFVAVSDINIGEKLDAQNVKLEEWPRDKVPEGAIRTLEELGERFPRTRLYAGEPILQAKLMDSREGTSPALTIPKGFRVVSVKVTVESSVSGLVQPGDRVDLLVFLRKSGEVPETGTKTILRDVNVFSVDGETQRSVDADGEARNLRTVSLLVKPDQAESVQLASELGQLSLSLRRPDDNTETISDGVSIHSLLGTSPESANAAPAVPAASTNLADWLTVQSAAPAAEPVEPAAEAEPAWKMIFMTPTGLKEFRWHDVNQMPEEVLIGRQAEAAASPSPAAGRSEGSTPVDTEEEEGAADPPDTAPGTEKEAA
jgi:pilus assembly protein CpaB